MTAVENLNNQNPANDCCILIQIPVQTQSASEYFRLKVRGEEERFDLKPLPLEKW